MDRFLLDSSAILHLLAGSGTGAEIKKAIHEGEPVTSIICFCEVLNKSDMDKVATAKRFLSTVSFLPLTLSDGLRAEKIQADCRKKGKQVPTLDCLIAATAANSDATLVTADTDFERIDGMKKLIF